MKTIYFTVIPQAIPHDSFNPYNGFEIRLYEVVNGGLVLIVMITIDFGFDLMDAITEKLIELNITNYNLKRI